MAIIAYENLNEVEEIFHSGEKEATRELTEEYVNANSEAIFESIKNMCNRERQRIEGEKARSLVALKSELLNNPSDPIAGNLERDLTPIEFFDYRYTHYKRLHDGIKTVRTAADESTCGLQGFTRSMITNTTGNKSSNRCSAPKYYLPFHANMMSHNKLPPPSPCLDRNLWTSADGLRQ